MQPTQETSVLTLAISLLQHTDGGRHAQPLVLKARDGHAVQKLVGAMYT